MNRGLARAVRERARGRCEYCCFPQIFYPLPFQLDHIIAEKHGGESIESNLALSCPHCNSFKGPNIAGIDPDSGQLASLFHPRLGVWTEHFRFDGPQLIGLTPVGRVTVHVPAMNSNDVLLLRAQLLQEGLFLTDATSAPPSPAPT